MIVQVLPPNSGFDINYRAVWPSNKLDFTFLNVNENSERSFDLAEIAPLLILFNPSNLEYLSIIKRREKLGLPTVIEYTDNFLEVPPWNPAHATYGTRKGKDTFRRFVNSGCTITTTSEGFKEYLDSTFGIRSIVLRNQLPETPPAIKEKTKEICWGGSTGHMGDLRDFLPFLGGVEIVGDPLFKIIAPELSIHYPRPYEQYLEWISDFKIGIIPLTPTPYNLSRSDIKAVEMLSRGVVPICPEGIVYKDIPCPKYQDPKEIKGLVAKLLSVDDLLDQLRDEGYQYVLRERIEERERAQFFAGFTLENIEYESSDDIPLPLGKLSKLLEAVSEVPERRISLLEEYLEAYPDSLEGRLMYLRALEGDSRRFSEQFDLIDRDFPDELRHLSFNHQAELLDRLERLSKLERAQVLYHFVDAFLKVKDKTLLERAIKIFGSIHGARLMFELANRLQASGDRQAAKKIYNQLYTLALGFYPMLPAWFPNFQLIACLAKD